MDTILPDWRCELQNHRRLIRCPMLRREAFPLPKGRHGRTSPEIQLGWVKKMFRFFGRLEQARREIPQLK